MIYMGASSCSLSLEAAFQKGVGNKAEDFPPRNIVEWGEGVIKVKENLVWDHGTWLY